ncbi:MAG: NADPH:quinone oxidoreductase family protein [Burkholderiales bacterium]|nr:NADPH:quinone oxidoreductase family protein [Burkholderiales bacterium]
MRALLCKAHGLPETLTIEELASPVPGPGQVLIDVKAAGVNFPDALIIQNKYQLQPPLPFAPGAEFSGVVSAAGAGVTRFKPGDAVCGVTSFGAFAEEIVVDADKLFALPAGVPFDVAGAFILAYGTSHHALTDRGALQAGETLVVLGAAGGVGLAAVEIGKVLGARVIACASNEGKLALCRAHGADETINYSTEDIKDRIRELTGGKGADVVYDPVGGAYAEMALRSMAWRGRYLVVGFANGEIPRIPLNLPLLKGCSLVGVFWGSLVKHEPRAAAAGVEELFGWLTAGKLRPEISARYALVEAPAALRAMLNRRVTGKVVVLPEA